VRRLTPFQRKEGKFPLGLLIEGSFSETVEKLIDLIEKEKPSMIISVGDVVSESLIKKDVIPNVVIIDNKVMRKSVAPFSAKADETRYVRNPPGTLTEEALGKIQEVFKEKKRIRIVVDGEEDLLTLPAVLYAPENSLVVYGQPRRGIVAVKVTKKERERVRQVIEAMEQPL
jgi:uncharacterized protein (UPF0218 family)